MNTVFDWFSAKSGMWILILILLNLSLMVYVIYANSLWKGFNAYWRKFLTGSDNQNLDTVLYNQLRTTMRLEEDFDELREIVQLQGIQLQKCLRGIGIVRYDAFDDVGGQQSFVLSMLDGQSDGIIITTIYGRLDQRTYAKFVKNGVGAQALTEEENKALAMAKQSLAEYSEKK